MDDGKSSVDDWLSELLTTFRTTWDLQQAGHRFGLSNLEDFSSPCQLYLFWFKFEPDSHYSRLVRVALSGRPDSETEVIGPIGPADAANTLAEVLGWERWSQNIRGSLHAREDVRDNGTRMLVADTLKEAQEKLDKYIVLRARSRVEIPLVESKASTPLGFTWDIYGDPRTISPEKLITRSWFAVDSRPSRPLKVPKEPEPIRAHALHIFPHVRVGALHEPTPLEVLHGDRWLPDPSFEKAFDVQYDGRLLVVQKDGLIAIESESTEDAINDLNHLMACFLIRGLDVRAVRAKEICKAEIDPIRNGVSSWMTEGSSIRTASLPIGFEHPNLAFLPEVEIDRLKGMISEAEVVSGDQYVRSALSFLLEAHTHFESQEFRQSFVMSWFIIESWLNKNWADALTERNVSKTRKDRLNESDRITVAVRSEMLELLGVIGEAQLRKVNELRKIRNKVIHNGYDPIQPEAKDALEFAKELCTSEFIQVVSD